MVRSVMQNACYIIIFTLCVDRGDGHWKENERENLRRDIELYRRMREKIEREIEVFHDEYPEEQLDGDNLNTIHYKHMANIFHRHAETNTARTENVEKHNITPVDSITNNVTSKHIEHLESHAVKNVSKEATNETTKWPKFEEMLLAMGKKYDWKNDRWIKVKEKIKNTDLNIFKIRTKENEIHVVHEKHKFYYKFVKLNRSKNRRSVVVAVSAVR